MTDSKNPDAVAPPTPGKGNLSRPERKSLSNTDRVVYLLVRGITLFAFTAAALIDFFTIAPKLCGLKIPGDYKLFALEVSVYLILTGAIGAILMRAFVSSVRIGEAEMLASVQAGLWKFASYWIIILFAIALALILDLTIHLPSKKSDSLDPRVFVRAIFAPALLAVSVGFVPVLVDTRRESRLGRIKAAKSETPLPTTAPSTVSREPVGHGRTGSTSAIAVSMIVVAAIVGWLARQRR